MTADWVVIAAIFFGVGMFTDFFGLGTLWSNRGHWYVVPADQLETVMSNLVAMRAFDDSDGIAQEHVKLRAHATLPMGSDEVYYSVKVPHYVFQHVKYQMTEKNKLKLLGLTD